MASTAQMIEQAVTHLQEEVPAFKKLRLVFGLDLRAKGDRAQFNQLADEKSTVGSYRRAAETGHIRFEGDSNVAKLVIRVIEAHEQRAKLKKVH